MATIKQLNANPRNPRKIEKKKLEMLAKSMIEFGSLDGFVYNIRSKQLVGGHQRQNIMPDDARIIIENKYENQTQSGTIAEGHVLYNGEKWPYREVDWDDQKEKAANVAANKGAGDWDLPKLQDFVLELDNENFDLDLTMFDTEELKDLFGKDFGSDKDKDAIEDDVPEVTESISKLGDLYELGEHRLLCGDSTDQSTVERLMNGEKADMVFTDPPYGMNLNTDWSTIKTTDKVFREIKAPKCGGKYEPVIGDSEDFDPKILFELFNYVEEVFLWGADYYSEKIPNKNLGSWIVWDKRLDEKLDKAFGSSFELCWSKTKHKRDLARIKWLGLFGTEKEFDKKRVHPTQKPTLLVEWFFDRFGNTSHKVVDIFGGSGSTLIACEKTKRKCFMMELDPHYIDVIVTRWCKYTGISDIKRNGEKMTWVLK